MIRKEFGIAVLCLAFFIAALTGAAYAGMVYGYIKNSGMSGDVVVFDLNGKGERVEEVTIGKDGSYSINLKEDGLYKVIHKKSGSTTWIRSYSKPARQDINFN